MKILKISLLSILFAVVFGGAAFAAPNKNATMDRLQQVQVNSGYQNVTDENAAATYAGSIVRTVLGLLGVIFMILSFYAGYQWMTAQGETAKVDSAQKILTTAVIGFIVIISSYAIWAFVSSNLTKGVVEQNVVK